MPCRKSTERESKKQNRVLCGAKGTEDEVAACARSGINSAEFSSFDPGDLVVFGPRSGFDGENAFIPL